MLLNMRYWVKVVCSPGGEQYPDMFYVEIWDLDTRRTVFTTVAGVSEIEALRDARDWLQKNSEIFRN